jgi:hypothetical protein
VGDNIKTFTAAENPMKNASTLSHPSRLIKQDPQDPMKWTVAANNSTIRNYNSELNLRGHNAVCVRVVAPEKEHNTSVLRKVFEDLRLNHSRNCTIAIAPQRVEKTNSQKLIEKKRKARQKYRGKYMNKKGRRIPFQLSQYLVTGGSPLSNFDQNVQLGLTCLSVLIQMFIIGVAGFTLPVALLHKFGHYRSSMFPVRLRTRVRRTRTRTASSTAMNVIWKIFSFVREFGRVGHKKNMKIWQRGSGGGRSRSSQSLGSATTSDRRGRKPPSVVHRSCTSAFALVFFGLAIMDKVGDGVQAVFAPADGDDLKAAVGTCTRAGSYPSYTYPCSGGCLGETPDGSCPTFAASDDATGNPYGVMRDWDVSQVTSLSRSTSNFQLLCLLLYIDLVP